MQSNERVYQSRAGRQRVARSGCCAETGWSLEDAPDALAVGQLYVGCLRGVRLAPDAWTPAAVAADAAATAPDTALKFPLYFVAADDAPSRELRDAMVRSLKDDVVLREFRPADVGAGVVGRDRWLSKLRLALRAISEGDAASAAIVTDLDLVFFRPVAPLIDRLLRTRDIVFQRDAADKRDVNLGFFAFKCNDRVRTLLEGAIRGVTLPWNDTRYDLICRKGAGTACRDPSDQFVLNRLLRRPELLGLPTRATWGFLPLEVATESYLKTRVPQNGAFHMYFKTDNAVFHANAAAGHKRARAIKVDKIGGMVKHNAANRVADPCLAAECW